MTFPEICTSQTPRVSGSQIRIVSHIKLEGVEWNVFLEDGEGHLFMRYEARYNVDVIVCMRRKGGDSSC